MVKNNPVLNDPNLNVIEAKSAEEANRVDTTLFRFERFSETKNAYIYVRRGRR